MTKAIEMLDEVKESIVNAYEIKTGLSRAKISHLMDAETWMNANKAIELGFADDILEDKKKCAADETAFSFAARSSEMRLMNKLEAKFGRKPETSKCPLVEAIDEVKGTRIEELDKRLNLLK